MATKNQIRIGSDAEHLYVRINLACEIREDKEDGGYVCCCPALQVYSQGETLAEAETNIKEAVDLFIETCVERGTLPAALKELGFSHTAATQKRKVPRARTSRSAAVKRVEIPAYFPKYQAAAFA